MKRICISILAILLLSSYCSSRICPAKTRWVPHPRYTWQWQLAGTINQTVDVGMFDIDLFETSAETISQLHALGRTVICYFNAGAYEPYRSDSSQFPPEALGNVMDGWPDEKWLDIRNSVVKTIMANRLDLAVTKGCDGVEPDNVEGYNNDPGFDFTAADQLVYNKWLASEAHKRYLSIALKNDLDQIPDLVSDFDWELNEECSSYNECGTLLPFTTANKAVFGAVYAEDGAFATLCASPNSNDFDFIYKHLNLNAWIKPCRSYTSMTHNQYSCVGNDSSASSENSTCTPKTCTTLNFECGSPSDGCGNTLSCGSCVTPETCSESTGKCTSETNGSAKINVVSIATLIWAFVNLLSY